MKQILILILGLSVPLQSKGFFYDARWLEEPVSACAEDESQLGENKTACEYAPVPLEKYDQEYEDLISTLQGKYVDSYEDIRSANALSSKIIDQSKDSQSLYERELQNLKNNIESEYLLDLKNDIRLMAKTRQGIDAINKRYFCEVLKERGGPNTSIAKDCDRRKAEALEPFLKAEAALVSQNPLLGNSHIDDLVNEFASKASTKQNFLRSRIEICIGKFKVGRIASRDECDQMQKEHDQLIEVDAVSFDEEDLYGSIEGALEDSVKATKTLISRHYNVKSYIRNSIGKKDLTEEDLKELRKWIFHNRKLARDYFVASRPTEDSGSFNGFHCRLIKEDKANEDSAFVNSLLLDAAVMAIPIGGPFLAARAVSRVASLTKAGANLGKAGRGSTLANVGSELTAMGADTLLIGKEFEHCEEVIELSYSLKGIPEHVKEKYETCQKQLSKMTTSYVTAMLGGAFGLKTTLKAARKAREASSKLLNDFSDAIGKDISQLTPKEQLALQNLEKLPAGKRKKVLEALKASQRGCL